MGTGPGNGDYLSCSHQFVMFQDERDGRDGSFLCAVE